MPMSSQMCSEMSFVSTARPAGAMKGGVARGGTPRIVQAAARPAGPTRPMRRCATLLRADACLRVPIPFSGGPRGATGCRCPTSRPTYRCGRGSASARAERAISRYLRTNGRSDAINLRPAPQAADVAAVFRVFGPVNHVHLLGAAGEGEVEGGRVWRDKGGKRSAMAADE